jgi:hypothetical protein
MKVKCTKVAYITIVCCVDHVQIFAMKLFA